MAVEIPNPNSAGGKTVLNKQQSTGRLILEMLNSDINKILSGLGMLDLKKR